MSIGEIIAAASAGLIGLSTFIEVSKIKINPWSSLFKWIGSKMMEDVEGEIKEIKEEFKEQSEKQESLERQRDLDAIDQVKAVIFTFYNECKRGEKHSEAEFNYVIQQNKKYEKLIEKTQEPNGVYEAEFKYIMTIYQKCQDEHDFL